MAKTYITGANNLSMQMRHYIGERIHTAQLNKETIYTSDSFGVCQIVIHCCDRLDVPVIVFTARKKPQNNGSRNSTPVRLTSYRDICLAVDRVEIITYDGYSDNTAYQSLANWCRQSAHKPAHIKRFPFVAGLMR